MWITQEQVNADLIQQISELSAKNGELTRENTEQTLLIRMLFRMNREQALQALVEELHYTPEQVKAFEAKYG